MSAAFLENLYTIPFLLHQDKRDWFPRGEGISSNIKFSSYNFSLFVSKKSSRKIEGFQEIRSSRWISSEPGARLDPEKLN